MVYQFTDIYFSMLSPTCNAFVQSRDPLFKYVRKHSNRDRFEIVLTAEITSFSNLKFFHSSSFSKYPNKNKSKGAKSWE
jgi:hypothetical protein